jgi:RHS repeat-associated protein
MTMPTVCLFSEACPGPSIFTGKERDAESGNDYFSARYYASSMGRFLSPDDGSDQHPSDPPTWNLYGYARNNPLVNTDPSGRACIVGGDGSRTDDNSGGESCADVDRNNAQNPVASATVTSTYDQDERIQMLAGDISAMTSRASLFDAAARAYAWATVIDTGGGLLDNALALGKRGAAEAVRGGVGPVLKGKAGVDKAARQIEAEGGQVVAREVTVENSGGRARVDLVHRPVSSL